MAEGEAAQLRTLAQEARAAAAKLDADLEGLSGAYNSLEQHSFTLEARLRTLEEQSATGQLLPISGPCRVLESYSTADCSFWLISVQGAALRLNIGCHVERSSLSFR